MYKYLVVGRPFCFRSVFSSLLLFSSFLYHLRRFVTTSLILVRLISNFHSIMIVNRRFDSYTFEQNLLGHKVGHGDL